MVLSFLLQQRCLRILILQKKFQKVFLPNLYMTGIVFEFSDTVRNIVMSLKSLIVKLKKFKRNCSRGSHGNELISLKMLYMDLSATLAHFASNVNHLITNLISCHSACFIDLGGYFFSIIKTTNFI